MGVDASPTRRLVAAAAGAGPCERAPLAAGRVTPSPPGLRRDRSAPGAAPGVGPAGWTFNEQARFRTGYKRSYFPKGMPAGLLNKGGNQ